MDFLNEIFLPCLYSFIASLAFGIQFDIRFKHIAAAAIGGIISQLIFSVTELTESSELMGYFIASCAISLYAEILARRLKVPVNMYLVISIIPLVPGGYIYQAMITLIGGNTAEFMDRCANTFAIAGSIAMGVFAVSSLVRLVRTMAKKAI